MSSNHWDENRPVPARLQFSPITASQVGIGLKINTRDTFLININEAIDVDNSAGSSDAKKAALQQMLNAIQYVDMSTKPDTLAVTSKFHDLKKTLFRKIKAAYAENGIYTKLQAGNADSPIARIIADLPQDKADKLMLI